MNSQKAGMGKFQHYTGPAAGWGALRGVTNAWLGSAQPVKNIRALLKTNQHGGFDCPGCAWGEEPGPGRIKFCENGAKAVNWEATSRKVDADFFARHSVAQLRRQTDYWLEYQGRLIEPMRYDRASDHYVPISWDDAFALIGQHLNALDSPNQAEFYTSGRASNEAAFLYQLFVRIFGTNNFPDCSNMCHEASGVALGASIGTGKGTVTFADFQKADAIFVMGQNPGTNHPRMLEPLRDAVRRGAQVICFNPLRERGLERFQHPQNVAKMLSNSSDAMHTAYFRPALGGDLAALRGMAKFMLQWQRGAQRQRLAGVLDEAFILSETEGFQEYIAVLDATGWDEIVTQSGLSIVEIEQAARLFSNAPNTIFCWAMGITQHLHGVATIQEIVNLQLLRGNIGRVGAGLCPVRGHSNVQGDRTMGINERPDAAFLNRLQDYFHFSPPRKPGHNTVAAINALLEGRAKVFVGLGGNFAQATPDSEVTHAALSRCALNVQISTKLNRSHLMVSNDALILPCLGRTDIDYQAAGPQCVTVEDSFSMVHASFGQLEPISAQIKSEPWIIAGIASATLGDQLVDWQAMRDDYQTIRKAISHCIPGFDDFEQRLHKPGGFHLPNTATARNWSTVTGKAKFIASALPTDLLPEGVRQSGEEHDLVLQSLRSHDQYNTTIYGLDDRYRGVSGQREVIFVNPRDIEKLGLVAGAKVDLVSLWHDGVRRRVKGFSVLPYDIPAGQAAAYYPEVNPLVPLGSYGVGSGTPVSKFIPIKLERSFDVAPLAISEA
ncbi:MAG TPA: FdhF/YdeP family oxidoreductase [Pseudomonas sabulinigri]|uniref:Molybdopterin oxidoreductase domain-containing protein n=1 Tax=marine sediment metagenome TaxID=412755 RepID=A0A0F9TEZ4_9ZZZZ|nr:FdhF/YdeP family oxidoreductase [Halopseudomonas sabulinigri]HEC51241.1 FdhF/YdeP family oxidoreductase [Halopseudomonas sabulinigri]